MNIYTYLRASTKEQNAERAMQELREFATANKLDIAEHFVESASGATRDRPVLTQLLSILTEGDVVLVESMDRLTRLSEDEARALIGEFDSKQAKIVALDNQMSIDSLLKQQSWNERSLTRLMLEFAAQKARDDYTMRRKRQAEGIAIAKAKGKYVHGRPIDTAKRNQIAKRLRQGLTYNDIAKLLETSHATISSVSKELKQMNAD